MKKFELQGIQLTIKTKKWPYKGSNPGIVQIRGDTRAGRKMKLEPVPKPGWSTLASGKEVEIDRKSHCQALDS